jgi:hypothetical protein
MCECCNDARTWPGTVAARQFSEGCPHCGARLIWSIQRLPIAKSDASRRCKAMLVVWVANGFPEAEIRRLAKLADMPLAPLVQLRKRGG